MRQQECLAARGACSEFPWCPVGGRAPGLNGARAGPGGRRFRGGAVAGLGRFQFGHALGEAPREGSVDYVLSRFFEEEKRLVRSTIDRAVEALKCAIDNGLISAMNTFNKSEEI